MKRIPTSSKAFREESFYTTKRYEFVKLGCGRDLTLICLLSRRSISSPLPKYTDLIFGDRSFEPVFHPFHIYFFLDGKTPHSRKAFISIIT